ncbi:MAG: nitrate reductase molybdenum cofactor assembly chaperone [Actinomycetales bacterium]|nr:nitrate reductase molybdenum cofactor assembly chaperone [Actinomycetales bacterium]
MNRVFRRIAAQKVSGRSTALAHRIAALLLEYPSAELLELLPSIRAAAGELPERLAVPLLQVVDHLDGVSLAEAEARYVETFDLKRRCSPFLTYFAYGDTRKRGVALVEFKQAYRAGGFEVVDDELPDHLAVVLEFCSTGDEACQVEGIKLLLGHRAGLELLRLALLELDSPYAGALVAVCATLPELEGDEREAIAKLAAEGPPGEEVGLEPFAPPTYMPASGHSVEGARR